MTPIIHSEHITDFLKNFPHSGGIRVLVGGCFDLLHPGHISFLAKAREQGDILFLLLENDAMIQKRKGENRPNQNQQVRAEELRQTNLVNCVILLPQEMTNHDYDELVSILKPAIIATTKGDPYRHHKERQAHLVGGKVIDVIERIPQFSTTQLSNKTQ